MHTIHVTVTDFLASPFSPPTPDADPESSLSKASAARDEAFALRRIFGNFLRRMVGRRPILTQEQELALTIRRLGTLSPHLLADIGLTHAIVDDYEAPTAPQVTTEMPKPALTAQPVRAKLRPKFSPKLAAMAAPAHG